MYLFQFDPINILVKSKMTTNQEITCVIKKDQTLNGKLLSYFLFSFAITFAFVHLQI